MSGSEKGLLAINDSIVMAGKTKKKEFVFTIIGYKGIGKTTRNATKIEMSKYTVSQKKITLLYNEIHEEIMNTRVQIAGFKRDDPSQTKIIDRVDNILSKLNLDCPKKAINLFLNKNPKS